MIAKQLMAFVVTLLLSTNVFSENTFKHDFYVGISAGHMYNPYNLYETVIEGERGPGYWVQKAHFDEGVRHLSNATQNINYSLSKNGWSFKANSRLGSHNSLQLSFGKVIKNPTRTWLNITYTGITVGHIFSPINLARTIEKGEWSYNTTDKTNGRNWSIVGLEAAHTMLYKGWQLKGYGKLGNISVLSLSAGKNIDYAKHKTYFGITGGHIYEPYNLYNGCMKQADNNTSSRNITTIGVEVSHSILFGQGFVFNAYGKVGFPNAVQVSLGKNF